MNRLNIHSIASSTHNPYYVWLLRPQVYLLELLSVSDTVDDLSYCTFQRLFSSSCLPTLLATGSADSQRNLVYNPIDVLIQHVITEINHVTTFQRYVYCLYSLYIFIKLKLHPHWELDLDASLAEFKLGDHLDDERTAAGVHMRFPTPEIVEYVPRSPSKSSTISPPTLNIPISCAKTLFWLQEVSSMVFSFANDMLGKWFHEQAVLETFPDVDSIPIQLFDRFQSICAPWLDLYLVLKFLFPCLSFTSSQPCPYDFVYRSHLSADLLASRLDSVGSLPSAYSPVYLSSIYSVIGLRQRISQLLEGDLSSYSAVNNRSMNGNGNGNGNGDAYAYTSGAPYDTPYEPGVGAYYDAFVSFFHETPSNQPFSHRIALATSQLQLYKPSLVHKHCLKSLGAYNEDQKRWPTRGVTPYHARDRRPLARFYSPHSPHSSGLHTAGHTAGRHTAHVPLYRPIRCTQFRMTFMAFPWRSLFRLLENDYRSFLQFPLLLAPSSSSSSSLSSSSGSDKLLTCSNAYQLVHYSIPNRTMRVDAFTSRDYALLTRFFPHVSTAVPHVDQSIHPPHVFERLTSQSNIYRTHNSQLSPFTSSNEAVRSGSTRVPFSSHTHHQPGSSTQKATPHSFTFFQTMNKLSPTLTIDMTVLDGVLPCDDMSGQYQQQNTTVLLQSLFRDYIQPEYIDFSHYGVSGGMSQGLSQRASRDMTSQSTLMSQHYHHYSSSTSSIPPLSAEEPSGVDSFTLTLALDYLQTDATWISSILPRTVYNLRSILYLPTPLESIPHHLQPPSLLASPDGQEDTKSSGNEAMDDTDADADADIPMPSSYWGDGDVDMHRFPDLSQIGLPGGGGGSQQYSKSSTQHPIEPTTVDEYEGDYYESLLTLLHGLQDVHDIGHGEEKAEEKGDDDVSRATSHSSNSLDSFVEQSIAPTKATPPHYGDHHHARNVLHESLLTSLFIHEHAVETIVSGMPIPSPPSPQDNTPSATHGSNPQQNHHQQPYGQSTDMYDFHQHNVLPSPPPTSSTPSSSSCTVFSHYGQFLSSLHKPKVRDLPSIHDKYSHHAYPQLMDPFGQGDIGTSQHFPIGSTFDDELDSQMITSTWVADPTQTQHHQTQNNQLPIQTTSGTPYDFSTHPFSPLTTLLLPYPQATYEFILPQITATHHNHYHSPASTHRSLSTGHSQLSEQLPLVLSATPHEATALTPAVLSTTLASAGGRGLSDALTSFDGGLATETTSKTHKQKPDMAHVPSLGAQWTPEGHSRQSQFPCIVPTPTLNTPYLTYNAIYEVHTTYLDSQDYRDSCKEMKRYQQHYQQQQQQQHQQYQHMWGFKPTSSSPSSSRSASGVVDHPPQLTGFSQPTHSEHSPHNAGTPPTTPLSTRNPCLPSFLSPRPVLLSDSLWLFDNLLANGSLISHQDHVYSSGWPPTAAATTAGLGPGYHHHMVPIASSPIGTIAHGHEASGEPSYDAILIQLPVQAQFTSLFLNSQFHRLHQLLYTHWYQEWWHLGQALSHIHHNTSPEHGPTHIFPSFATIGIRIPRDQHLSSSSLQYDSGDHHCNRATLSHPLPIFFASYMTSSLTYTSVIRSIFSTPSQHVKLQMGAFLSDKSHDSAPHGSAQPQLLPPPLFRRVKPYTLSLHVSLYHSLSKNTKATDLISPLNSLALLPKNISNHIDPENLPIASSHLLSAMLRSPELTMSPCVKLSGRLSYTSEAFPWFSPYLSFSEVHQASVNVVTDNPLLVCDFNHESYELFTNQLGVIQPARDAHLTRTTMTSHHIDTNSGDEPRTAMAPQIQTSSHMIMKQFPTNYSQFLSTLAFPTSYHGGVVFFQIPSQNPHSSSSSSSPSSSRNDEGTADTSSSLSLETETETKAASKLPKKRSKSSSNDQIHHQPPPGIMYSVPYASFSYKYPTLLDNYTLPKPITSHHNAIHYEWSTYSPSNPEISPITVVLPQSIAEWHGKSLNNHFPSNIGSYLGILHHPNATITSFPPSSALLASMFMTTIPYNISPLVVFPSIFPASATLLDSPGNTLRLPWTSSVKPMQETSLVVTKSPPILDRLGRSPQSPWVLSSYTTLEQPLENPLSQPHTHTRPMVTENNIDDDIALSSSHTRSLLHWLRGGSTMVHTAPLDSLQQQMEIPSDYEALHPPSFFHHLHRYLSDHDETDRIYVYSFSLRHKDYGTDEQCHRWPLVKQSQGAMPSGGSGGGVNTDIAGGTTTTTMGDDESNPSTTTMTMGSTSTLSINDKQLTTIVDDNSLVPFLNHSKSDDVDPEPHIAHNDASCAYYTAFSDVIIKDHSIDASIPITTTISRSSSTTSLSRFDLTRLFTAPSSFLAYISKYYSLSFHINVQGLQLLHSPVLAVNRLINLSGLHVTYKASSTSLSLVDLPTTPRVVSTHRLAQLINMYTSRFQSYGQQQHHHRQQQSESREETPSVEGSTRSSSLYAGVADNLYNYLSTLRRYHLILQFYDPSILPFVEALAKSTAMTSQTVLRASDDDHMDSRPVKGKSTTREKGHQDSSYLHFYTAHYQEQQRLREEQQVLEQRQRLERERQKEEEEERRKQRRQQDEEKQQQQQQQQQPAQDEPSSTSRSTKQKPSKPSKPSNRKTAATKSTRGDVGVKSASRRAGGRDMGDEDRSMEVSRADQQPPTQQRKTRSQTRSNAHVPSTSAPDQPHTRTRSRAKAETQAKPRAPSKAQKGSTAEGTRPVGRPKTTRQPRAVVPRTAHVRLPSVKLPKSTKKRKDASTDGYTPGDDDSLPDAVTTTTTKQRQKRSSRPRTATTRITRPGATSIAGMAADHSILDNISQLLGSAASMLSSSSIRATRERGKQAYLQRESAGSKTKSTRTKRSVPSPTSIASPAVETTAVRSRTTAPRAKRQRVTPATEGKASRTSDRQQSTVQLGGQDSLSLDSLTAFLSQSSQINQLAEQTARRRTPAKRSRARNMED